MAIKKVYGYVSRINNGSTQVLVFRHPNLEAGIQIPKGTVQPNENTDHAVVREIIEETGLEQIKIEKLITEDYWKNVDGAIHHRFFYKINVSNTPDYWEHEPTGGGPEEGLTFSYFWISSENEIELVDGHGDYLKYIF